MNNLPCRFAHFEAVRIPGAGALRPLLRHRIHHEFDDVERLVRSDRRPWRAERA